MRLSSFLFFVTVSLRLFAQEKIPERGDFMFPVRPKQENYLSGTVGELRRTHFHMGIDIKTSGITGLPIYATADGYIQRIRVSTSGYGNAIYMAHPQNGTVSVYAHLKSFDPALAAYVRNEQYKKESFDVNLFPKEGQFKFLKGDIIAQSGNTGSSAGPHLHFELRTEEHLVLDPLVYGFEEIIDTEAPILQKIAFVAKNADARINGQFGRHEFRVNKTEEGTFQIEDNVYLNGLIGVEIYAYDKFNGARNRNGILYQTLLLDGKEVFNQTMDSLKFADSKSVLIHTNYARSVQGGSRFNKLYIDDGNELDFYTANAQRGLIDIGDPLAHEIQLRLEDSYGNVTQVNIPINSGEEEAQDARVSSTLKSEGFELFDNFIEFTTDLSEHGYCEASIYQDGMMKSCQMAYDIGDKGYYIWDLRQGLPDSIWVCDERYKFRFADMIPSVVKTKWEDQKIDINFPAKCLFDTAYLQYEYYKKGEEENFVFDNATTALRRNYYATLHPERSYNKEKASVYAVDSRGDLSFVGGEWQESGIAFKNRFLQHFTIVEDLEPPTIKLISNRNGKLRFTIKDDLSGIGEFRAELDGRWLLMNYDAKRNLLWSDTKVEVKGNFKLHVIDNVENGTVFEAVYK